MSVRQIAVHELAYVAWQNRATRFYLAARALHSNGLVGPAAYCCHQATELILKATLVFWDRSFNPRDAGHNLTKLCRIVRNKVRGAKRFEIPAYLGHEQRFLSVSRYPSNGKGVFVPSHVIVDPDKLFVELIELVPFQHNTDLRRAIRGSDRRALSILRKGNHRDAEASSLSGIEVVWTKSVRVEFQPCSTMTSSNPTSSRRCGGHARKTDATSGAKCPPCFPLFLVCAAFSIAACGPSKTETLQAEVDALRIENIQLRIALEQANENIQEAASAMETAQSSVGEKYRDLASAVEEMTVPDEVEIPLSR